MDSRSAASGAAATDALPARLPLQLGEQLCFALYSTNLAMNKVYRALLGELGLTYPQYLVLLVLWEKDRLRVSQIGDRLFLDTPTLTPLLKRMEALGVLGRRRARDDERQVIVALTRKGQAMKRRARGVVAGVFCATECAPQQIAALRDSLLPLRERLFRNAALATPKA